MTSLRLLARTPNIPEMLLLLVPCLFSLIEVAFVRCLVVLIPNNRCNNSSLNEEYLVMKCLKSSQEIMMHKNYATWVSIPDTTMLGATDLRMESQR